MKMKASPWLARCGVISVTVAVFLLSTTAMADELKKASTGGEEIILADPVNSERVTHVRYSLAINGKLITPATTGTTDWNLSSSAKFEFDQRRFASDSPGPLALRAARQFQEAETSSVVGKDHKNSVVLPAQSRLIHLYGSEMQLIQLSPAVRLTRPQVDLLQFPCDPLVAAGLLPNRNLRDMKEKWNADSGVVPMLTGIDALVSQSATCSLKSLTDAEATIMFDCRGTGAITGSPTEIELTGEMVLDRKASLLRRLNATLKEKRGPGTVSPGLNVTAKIQWEQEIAGGAEVPESISETMPDERQLLLTLVTPWRVLLLHNRNWHIFHETSELVMLRMLHNGALVGQCNIASAPLMAAGKFTPESDYVAEVDKALKERGGRIEASEVAPDLNGWRIHHVRATGEANKKTLVWDYYLCTTKAGEQISLVFSHAEEDERIFAGVADQMLQSLTIRSVRPRITLPR